MEIRKMRPEDERAVYSMMCSALDEYFAPEVVSYFMMQWPSGQLVACDIMGHVIGYIAGAKLPNGNASIALFCVDPSYQGRGVGSMLVTRFKTSALMEGISTLQLEVKESNTSAMEFYRKRGFVPTERLDGFYNDGSAGIRMVASVGTFCRSINRTT